MSCPSSAARQKAGQTVVLGIRPEAVKDIDGAGRHARNVVQVACRDATARPCSDAAVTPKSDTPRPWGSFRLLDEGPGFKVKRIVVAPRGRLSLQSHRHRAEHWTVVAGEATVTVGQRVSTLRRGEAVDIAQGDRHRLENFGAVDLEVIEVQFGDYLGEDDVVRHDDAYRRG